MNTTTATTTASRWVIALAAETAEIVAARNAHEEFSDAWMAADALVARAINEASGAGESIAFTRLLNAATATASPDTL